MRNILCLLLACSFCGCGGEEGPARFPLQGKVTFRGKPVPKGLILFQPDAKAGNSGPGTSAEIENGAYRTAEGQGTVGGPHLVTINGSDGVAFQEGPQINPMGKPIFANAQYRLDLPQEPFEHDFAID